jgi:ribosomal RNA-processing protein 17
MPASSKRAKDKAKAAKKKDDITKNRSMETKAERKKGRALELTRRVGKAGRAMEVPRVHEEGAGLGLVEEIELRGRNTLPSLRCSPH